MSLFLCTFLGYVLALKYTDKRRFFECFSGFNKRLINEISFSLNTFPKILSSSREENSFILLAKRYVSSGDFSCDYKYLTIDEKQFVKEYLDNTGKSDRESQLKFFNSVSTEIDSKLFSVRNDEKKYKSLYIKIGFLIGLIALIIFL